MKKDYSIISPTAILCAMARAEYTKIPFAKEIYEELSKEERESSEKLVSPFLIKVLLSSGSSKGAVSLLEGRYLSTNDALKKLKKYNVLEIASGLSSRGLDFSFKDKDMIYVETDLPKMIKIKKQILTNISKKNKIFLPKNYHLISLNAMNYNSFRKLMPLFKGSKSPIAVIHEGLLTYLDIKEQERLRDNILRFLKENSPTGAWITPDFSGRDSMREGILGKIVKRIKKKTKEGHSFKSFKEVRNFLGKSGFKLKVLPNSSILDRLDSKKILKIKKSDLKKIADNYLASFITLKR